MCYGNPIYDANVRKVLFDTAGSDSKPFATSIAGMIETDNVRVCFVDQKTLFLKNLLLGQKLYQQ